jgi:hypothetical protein
MHGVATTLASVGRNKEGSTLTIVAKDKLKIDSIWIEL